MSNKTFKPLETVDSKTLMETPLQQAGFVVDSLLTEGVHILCGAPKTGKSWLALAICDSIAKGTPVWNFAARQSGVLYLCLEDSYARLQHRLYDITDEGSENLYLAVMAGSLKNTLPDQIEDFVRQHPGTRFVVIDTLQKIRTVTNDNAYASDYSDISILKTLAAKLHLCILLIHHIRKEADPDPFNMVSDTTGITGAVDSTMVLQVEHRAEKDARLYCTGRDIEYRELDLRFDSEAHRWELLRDSVEQPVQTVDPTIEKVAALIRRKGAFTGTATELLAELLDDDGKPLTASVLSKKMVRHNDALAKLGIHFEMTRTGTRRELTLACDGNDGNDVCGGVPDLPSQLSLPSREGTQAPENALVCPAQAPGGMDARPEEKAG